MGSNTSSFMSSNSASCDTKSVMYQPCGLPRQEASRSLKGCRAATNGKRSWRSSSVCTSRTSWLRASAVSLARGLASPVTPDFSNRASCSVFRARTWAGLKSICGVSSTRLYSLLFCKALAISAASSSTRPSMRSSTLPLAHSLASRHRVAASGQP